MAGNLKPEGVSKEVSIIFLDYNKAHPSYASPDVLCDGLVRAEDRFLLDTYYEVQYGVAYFIFKVGGNCNIWALGESFSDAGGTTPKPVRLYRQNENGEFDFVGEYQTEDTGWYILFKNLKAGTYKLMASRDRATSFVRDYARFAEWYAEGKDMLLYLKDNAIYGMKHI